MLSWSVIGMLQLLISAIPVGLFIALVGLAVRVAADRRNQLPGSLSVTAGIGLAVTMVVVTYSFVFARALRPTIVGLGLICAVVVVIGTVRPPGGGGLAGGMRRLGPWLVSRGDVVGLLAAVGVLAPVSGYARQFFTNGMADFPSYAASAEVWRGLAGEGPNFRAAHPGTHGYLLEARALNEKPMVTAFMVMVQTVSRVLPDQQLALLMLIFLAISAGALIATLRTVFGLGMLAASCAVLPAAWSSVPLSRVYDAQPGQLAVMACGAALMACLVGLARAGTYGVAFGLAAATGVVGAGLVGCNVSLVGGLGPVLLAMAAVLANRVQCPPRRQLALAGVVGAVGFVLTAPLVSEYLWSIRGQVLVDSFFNMPLASPLAFLGLQRFDPADTSLDDLPFWGLVLVLLWIGWYRRGLRARRETCTVLVAGVIFVAMAAILFDRYGAISYQTHKWMAGLIVLLGPFVLGWILASTGVLARWLSLAAGYCAITALVFTYLTTSSVFAVPAGVNELRDSAVLKALPAVNIDTNHVQWDGIAEVTAPSAQVIGLNFAGWGTAPVGSYFLVAHGQPARGNVVSRQQINADMDLVQLQLTLPVGRTVLSTQNPNARTYLYGFDSIDQMFAWSSGDTAYVAFDLPDQLRNRPVNLTLSASRFDPHGQKKTLIVSTEKRELTQQNYFSTDPIDVTVTLQPSDVVDGRVVLVLTSPDPVFIPDAPAPRALGVGLTAITLAPAGS